MARWSYEGMGYLRRDGEIVLQLTPKPGKGWTDTAEELVMVERIVALLNAAEPGGVIEQAAHYCRNIHAEQQLRDLIYG